MSAIRTGWRYSHGCWRGGRGQIHVTVIGGWIVSASLFAGSGSSTWASGAPAKETAQGALSKSAPSRMEKSDVQPT